MTELILNNKSIKKVKISELINEYCIIVPEIQRIIDISKVNEIIEYQLRELKEKNRTNFLGVLSLNHLEEKYYLIDGQHRYRALKKMYEDYSHDIEIFAEIIDIESKVELKNNYIILNKNTQLPELLEIDSDKSILKESMDYFQEKYPEVWSNKSVRGYRPFINFNYFQETIDYLINELKIIDSKNLIKYIEDKNDYFKTWNRDRFSGITETQYEKAVKWKFYLGLYSYSSNDKWGYDWARNIVKDVTGVAPEKFRIKKKKPIPKKIKDDCWNKYVGKNKGGVYCLVCNTDKIYQNNFEAGHIISEFNNGAILLDNLLPICSKCNKGMGCKNMIDWITKWYPQNLSRFNNKEYRDLESISIFSSFF